MEAKGYWIKGRYLQGGKDKLQGVLGGEVGYNSYRGRYRERGRGSFQSQWGSFYMSRDKYKVWVGGELKGGDPGRRVSLWDVGHLPDDDVAPLSFAQGRFHLRCTATGTLSLLCLVVLSVT